jgi:AraC-like DNA-binding protein
MHLCDDRGVAILELDKDTASLGYAAFCAPHLGGWDLVDATIALQFNMLKLLCGPSWRPIEILLPRQRPKATQPFERFFEASLRFGAEHGHIVFSSDWLAHPVSGADPLIYQLVEERVAKLDAELNHGIESQLRRLLRTLVLSRRCSLAAAAQLLNTGPRTLARRLEREKVSFRALADEVCYEVARHLLAGTSLTMTQIALFLDYSEASAFARAFRRWSGIAPTTWRALDPGVRDARSRRSIRAAADMM